MRPLLLLLALTSFAAKAELAIVQPRLLLYEDGAPAEPGHRFRAGETVYLTFLLSGYGRSSDEEAPKVNLSYNIEVADPQGLAVAEPKFGKVEAVLAPEDKKWLPKVRYQVTIPEDPSAGTYEIRVRAKDEISNEESAQRVSFAVAGEPAESSGELAVHRFRYLPAGGERPIETVRAGDAFDARFMLTGYKLGPKNKYSVKYGVAFVDEAGKPVFANPNAASIVGESFYPRRHLPAGMSLKLDSKVQPGRYRLKIDVEDLLGGLKMSQEFPVTVER